VCSFWGAEKLVFQYTRQAEKSEVRETWDPPNHKTLFSVQHCPHRQRSGGENYSCVLPPRMPFLWGPAEATTSCCWAVRAGRPQEQNRLSLLSLSWKPPGQQATLTQGTRFKAIFWDVHLKWQLPPILPLPQLSLGGFHPPWS
jgi:hypothetical protein